MYFKFFCYQAPTGQGGGQGGQTSSHLSHKVDRGLCLSIPI